MAKKRKVRRKSKRASETKRGGLMVGMRRGFKDVASGAVEGKGRFRWLETVVLVLLIIAALFVLSKRF